MLLLPIEKSSLTFVCQRAISLSFRLRQTTISYELLTLVESGGIASQPHSSDKLEMDTKYETIGFHMLFLDTNFVLGI